MLCYRDLSFNNLSGPVPKSPARTFKYISDCLIVIFLAAIAEPVVSVFFLKKEKKEEEQQPAFF
jgi:hypothetical protein